MVDVVVVDVVVVDVVVVVADVVVVVGASLSTTSCGAVDPVSRLAKSFWG